MLWLSAWTQCICCQLDENVFNLPAFSLLSCIFLGCSRVIYLLCLQFKTSWSPGSWRAFVAPHSLFFKSCSSLSLSWVIIPRSACCPQQQQHMPLISRAPTERCDSLQQWQMVHMGQPAALTGEERGGREDKEKRGLEQMTFLHTFIHKACQL